MSYRICESCGASLDPGERCDCLDSQSSGSLGKEKAAPVLEHQSGKVEKVLADHIPTAILQNNREGCQE